MKILITGASSYVGARLYFDLKKDFKVIGTYYNSQLCQDFIKLNITSKSQIEKTIQAIKPDYIIHVANIANSRWCQANPRLAKKINLDSTKYIVDAANNVNAQLIFISSFAAVSPTNFYGKAKLKSESIVKQTKKGWLILRPSLIIGFSPNTINDRPFNRLLRNLEGKTEAVYDTSWKFQSSFLTHISQVIKECIKKKITNQIIPIVVDKISTRYSLAKDILTPLGIKVKPVDRQTNMPLVTDNLSQLKKFNLPVYIYSKMIQEIINEIKNKDKFRL